MTTAGDDERRAAPAVHRSSRGGLSVELYPHGALRRFDAGAVTLNLFIGNALEGGPANLYLRRLDGAPASTPLIGPRSPSRCELGDEAVDAPGSALSAAGTWQGIRYRLALVLASEQPAWFWHVELQNTSAEPVTLDLIHAQDVGLSPYGALRLNEYYVSQYVDHTALQHAERGWVVASRQNQAVAGQHPWCLIGSQRRGVAFATDALQLHGLAERGGTDWPGLAQGLASRRLQHEHSLVVVQDAPVELAAGAAATLGFFGCFQPDHAAATLNSDTSFVDIVMALPEAAAPVFATGEDEDESDGVTETANLFANAPVLATQEAGTAELERWFATPWRHVECDEAGRLLSFFHGDDRHVALRAKELVVLRPHGHLLRSGALPLPDESALTSTTWMTGVFHSMLTQGHVSINRFLSTVHGYLGLFRSQGQRVFIDAGSGWRLLDLPTAYEMAPDACRWIYRHDGGVIEVLSQVDASAHEMSLQLRVLEGTPVRWLISHHLAIDGDDGSLPGVARFIGLGKILLIEPRVDSELGKRFPNGAFVVEPIGGGAIARVGGDEFLYADGVSREEPYLCFVTGPTRSFGLRLRAELIDGGPDVPARGAAAIGAPALLAPRRWQAPESSPLAESALRLDELLPWLRHDALIHFLSPRGLEQYSGGGWGTRDVCQGPVELLLADGHTAPVRDLLLRVMRAQNADGDWPQWFTFFDRERNIRAGDSHGDIVFWPLLALAQYLIASGDASILDERLPFFDEDKATVWQHAERALALIDRRRVQSTALAAYGHGDWNDALQPADPAMREHMCSAWTVTLHHQMLTTFARALRTIGREADAVPLEAGAAAVRHDFRRLLLVDGVLAGYARFDESGEASLLLHPRDETTGVRFSALAMIHAIAEDLFTPDEARSHLALIDEHLSGPDGLRLFDRPMAYHGGPQRHFQRAESASFFGREIGLMYMHAHLRYAQALAHVGETEGFFHALSQACPIGIHDLVASATRRQANCYYSSSDAAFADRYEASEEYGRVRDGTVALDGGWRIYSSGAGITYGLIVGRLLGLRIEAGALIVDPVLPATLDGLRITTALWGRPVDVVYAVGGTGHGVAKVELGGTELPLERLLNPHRLGAARLARAAIESRLDANSVLTLHVGH